MEQSVEKQSALMEGEYDPPVVSHLESDLAKLTNEDNNPGNTGFVHLDTSD